MSFDGVKYVGSPLIAPSSYHPGAPGVGIVCSSSLQNAYYVSREESRIVGAQTYYVHGIFDQRKDLKTYGITGTSYKVVGRFRHDLKAWHTLISVRGRIKVISLSNGTITIKLSATDGTNTDTDENTTIDFSDERTLQERANEVSVGDLFGPIQIYEFDSKLSISTVSATDIKISLEMKFSSSSIGYLSPEYTICEWSTND